MIISKCCTKLLGKVTQDFELPCHQCADTVLLHLSISSESEELLNQCSESVTGWMRAVKPRPDKKVLWMSGLSAQSNGERSGMTNHLVVVLSLCTTDWLLIAR